MHQNEIQTALEGGDGRIMKLNRVAATFAVLVSLLLPTQALAAAQERLSPNDVLHNWYGLVLELVRHTATYSPPVASRAFAYMGVTVFEAVAGGSDELVTLGGQLQALEAVPQRVEGLVYDDAIVIDAAMAASVEDFFSNTGPTGRRAITAAGAKWGALAAEGVDSDVAERSVALGRAIAAHIHEWSQDDGGAAVENLGFPQQYAVSEEVGRWVPTSTIQLQQAPLLPNWGNNRTFALPDGATCGLEPPPAYSEDPASDFWIEAEEVYQATMNLTEEQEVIARFWSDDPMLSSTPPGHWLSIAFEVIDGRQLSVEDSVDVLARLGIGVADAFIGCWHEKYRHDLVRPVTYIRSLIDGDWEPILITPPFPEYPSGHSTQSGAAATVLTGVLGDAVAFTDNSGVREGFEPRSYPSFWAAADEAGISRLYGGIHFRAAIERGLDQGRCIGNYALSLRTRR